MTIKDNPKVDWSDKILASASARSLPLPGRLPPGHPGAGKAALHAARRPGRGPGRGPGALPFPRHPGPHLHPSLRAGLHPQLPGPAHCHRRAETLPGGPGPRRRSERRPGPGPAPAGRRRRGRPRRAHGRVSSCAASATRSPSSRPNLSWAGPCGSTSPPTACPGRCWSGR